ncbi:MAG: sigma-70 family RNA polymerase sigma factor [Phycisphaerales bacterium]|nr:sigma-70 family RNA polymerase sigma factor [Phycisphaerales bacterium]
MDQRSDEQLVQAYRMGEREAMEALVRRYQPELLGFLSRQLGNRAAAEDVFQETFLQVHQSADDFDVSRRFRPWLFTIAANKGRDWYRKNSRRLAMVDLSAPVRPGGTSENATGTGANIIDFLADSGEPIDAHLDETELRELVRKTIDSMPEHLREILLLAYFQRLSYNDIAESLEIPLGTVKSRLHAAVAKFADQWRRVNGKAEADFNQ